ncbi:MAG: hypothetical protein Q7T36_06415 [Fluviicoccus sp.]|uniref:hypothetical protein n=1 Tax=Fluviicoccus sp. TaxID=2003552 RepID=UPI0027272EA4|nr:hypothetical protein [Fluviicoccus sp.]MDO8330087.1 hypothetical protein [Fluviicoccus sp.]
MNFTKIALIVLFTGLGLFAVQLSAGFFIMKKYESCAAEWRGAHPGTLSEADMKRLITESANCVEKRLNAFERLFFNAEAARGRSVQVIRKEAPMPTKSN